MMRGVFVLKVRDIWVGGYKFELDTALGLDRSFPMKKSMIIHFLEPVVNEGNQSCLYA